jgi:hypothetical protein
VRRNELGPTTGRGFYEWGERSLESWKKRVQLGLVRFLRSDQID